MVAIHKEVLGEKHPLYATSLNNLASVLEANGDFPAARSLSEQALRINEAALGKRHPAYAASLTRLAAVFESQGDYAAAKLLLERSLTIRKERLRASATLPTPWV